MIPSLFKGGSRRRLGRHVPGKIDQLFPFLCINSLSLLAWRKSAFDISPFDMYLVADNDELSFQN